MHQRDIQAMLQYHNDRYTVGKREECQRTMRLLAKVAIRLFVVYSLVSFVDSLGTMASQIVTVRNTAGFEPSEVWNAYFPYVGIWISYLALLVLLWFGAGRIAARIVGDTDAETNLLGMGEHSALKVGLFILGIYLLLDTIPEAVRWFASYITTKRQYQSWNEIVPSEVRASQTIGILWVATRMFLSIVLLTENKYFVGLLRFGGHQNETNSDE